MVATTTEAAWQRLAESLAREAYEIHFPSRQGVWFIEDRGVICLYNNNHYPKHPTFRDEELAKFRARMRAEGIKELAYGTYPPEGQEAAGGTYAMVIGAGKDKMGWVAETMEDIVRVNRPHAIVLWGDRSHTPTSHL
jgi:hypothetical protein